MPAVRMLSMKYIGTEDSGKHAGLLVQQAYHHLEAQGQHSTEGRRAENPLHWQCIHHQWVL